MKTLLCCSSAGPFRPQYLQHEAKFNAFTKWADYLAHHVLASTSIETTTDPNATVSNPNPSSPRTPYAVQFVRNKANDNSSPPPPPPPNSSRSPSTTSSPLITRNLIRMCPVNTHEWRARFERSAGNIDLSLAGKGCWKNQGKNGR
ncbi:MFS multidrug transporter protein [Rutstroemia sp. NJR-2017a BVV2]|nr:MFS multidrug transporter protein [Rutstroemia sp. NJR-2017a BVV2]